MRFADRRRLEERERLREPRRPEPPTAYDQLLALQRGAGNRAVARFLNVQQIDFNPLSGNFHTSHLDVATFLQTISGSNFHNACTQNEKGRLQNIDAANLAALDVPRLADAVIQHLTNGSQPRINALTPHRSTLEGALVVAAPREVSDKEENVFKRLLNRASQKSRSKGTPNRIALASLTQFEPEMANGVNFIHGLVAARNQDLGVLNTFTAEPSLSTSDHAANGLPVRSAHMNMAGWLQQHNVAATLDVAANAWAQQMAVSGGGMYQSEIVRLFGAAPAGVTPQMIESSDLDLQVKRRYYREVMFTTLGPPRQCATHAWREYANSTLPGCPFIEFTASGAGGLSRYVWDYVNDRWYVNVHYNWVLGYNPFFRVDGLGPTI